MTPPILRLLKAQVESDIEELGLHGITATEEMDTAHADYQNIEFLERDLRGLQFRRHKFDLISSKRDGRYIFRQLHTDNIPPYARPPGYEGVFLIPVWVSNRSRLHPNYRAAKARIKAHRDKLLISDEQASRIQS